MNKKYRIRYALAGIALALAFFPTIYGFCYIAATYGEKLASLLN